MGTDSCGQFEIDLRVYDSSIGIAETFNYFHHCSIFGIAQMAVMNLLALSGNSKHKAEMFHALCASAHQTNRQHNIHGKIYMEKCTWKIYGKVGQHAKRKNNNKAVLVLENHLLYTTPSHIFHSLPHSPCWIFIYQQTRRPATPPKAQNIYSQKTRMNCMWLCTKLYENCVRNFFFWSFLPIDCRFFAYRQSLLPGVL